jgi:hypothetical protein
MMISDEKNEKYNDMLSDLADFENDDTSEYDKFNTGKRVPYLGGVWRNVNFKKPIPIGICQTHHMIGIMQKNKWDYPERTLTKNEREELINLLNAAYELYEKSDKESCGQELEKIWLLADKWDTYEESEVKNGDNEQSCDRGVWWHP